MNEEQKLLLEQYEAMVKEQGVLLNKGQEMTGEDLEKAKLLNPQIDALQVKLAQMTDTANLKTQNKNRLDLLNRPMTSYVHPSGHVKFVGFTEAGEAQIETISGGRQRLEQKGAALLGEKQWKAISQTDYEDAMDSYIRKKGWSGLTNLQQKTLQEGSDVDGGYWVGPEMLGRVIEHMPAPTRIVAAVDTITTVKDSIILPYIPYATDDIHTTPMRVTWTGEVPATATVARVTQPTFGQKRIPVFTAMMSIPLTFDLLEDSGFDLQAYLERKFVEEILLTKASVIISGTGNGQPFGLLSDVDGTNGIASVVTGDANLLTADGIQDLTFAIPEQYDENCSYYFNKKSTGKALSKLKDGDGRYLWGFGAMDNGMARSVRNMPLFGYNYAYEAQMPDVAASAYPILFGDARGYTLVERLAISVKVLDQPYAEQNMVILLVRFRLGGAVLEPWRIKAQKVSA